MALRRDVLQEHVEPRERLFGVRDAQRRGRGDERNRLELTFSRRCYSWVSLVCFASLVRACAPLSFTLHFLTALVTSSCCQERRRNQRHLHTLPLAASDVIGLSLCLEDSSAISD
ncbi:hypothetical protein AAFF_G00208740 [Aldrovandia affinis]|uniref:Uncharacterized protein n=1 Tax=Aldrovandia affinis TaxID=143900 RepID=A0AAD7RGV6_9TELE|nr:hypothetical protein AAFF_G00208740 [Aldrovandia affinis]